MKTALVLGAGGFIGSHLVARLKLEGYWVRGVDLKLPEFSESNADEFLIYDLRDNRNVQAVVRSNVYEVCGHRVATGFNYFPNEFDQKSIPFDEIYQLAADMGGAGYVFTGEHDADIMHNSAMINLNVAENSSGVGKLFYSSSACMYPKKIQVYNTAGLALKESDAYPADPDSEYGWEKLFSERLYMAYARNHGLNVRIARFHNIYGPEGTYKGGREKAPAAMCRKVIETKKWNKTVIIKDGQQFDSSGNLDRSGYFPPEIEVWGDGQQTRSFLYIDDCIDAVRLLMESNFQEPINIGSEEMVSINDLAKMAIDISGKSIQIKNIEGPTGVRGRNSDNTLIRSVLGWEPKYSLNEGLQKTYYWIENEINK